MLSCDLGQAQQKPVLRAERHPALRWHDTILGFLMERENLSH